MREAESALAEILARDTGADCGGVAEALQIIDELRAAGEVTSTDGYELELVALALAPRVAA